MLIISRRSAESISIRPADGIDLNMTLNELFRDGPIEFKVLGSGMNRVKVGISAPKALSIWRSDPAAPDP